MAPIAGLEGNGAATDGGGETVTRKNEEVEVNKGDKERS